MGGATGAQLVAELGLPPGHGGVESALAQASSVVSRLLASSFFLFVTVINQQNQGKGIQYSISAGYVGAPIRALSLRQLYHPARGACLRFLRREECSTLFRQSVHTSYCSAFHNQEQNREKKSME